MASNIDITKPTSGTATTSSVRSNFSAAKTEIEALQANQVVAAGVIISDGSGAQSVTNTFGVTSVTISGTTFLIVLDSAVAGAGTMIITTGSGAGIGTRTDVVNQTSTTGITYSLVLNGTAVVTSGLEFHFSVLDAG